MPVDAAALSLSTAVPLSMRLDQAAAPIPPAPCTASLPTFHRLLAAVPFTRSCAPRASPGLDRKLHRLLNLRSVQFARSQAPGFGGESRPRHSTTRRAAAFIFDRSIHSFNRALDPGDGVAAQLLRGNLMQTLDKRAPSRDEFLSQGRQFLKFHDLFLLKNSARCSELHQYDNVRRRCACGTRSGVTRASRYRCIRVAWARCKAGAAARFACRNRRPFPASALPSPPCARSRTLP